MSGADGVGRLATWEPPGRKSRLHVVLFSGGRGSSVLSTQLIGRPEIRLTVVINGYDDGLSTGEVRKFLGDSLGPSDFRKNASRLARAARTCGSELLDLLDLRLPAECTPEEAEAVLAVVGAAPAPAGSFAGDVQAISARLDAASRDAVSARLARFECERRTTGKPFQYADCCLGNLVFAGCFLDNGRRFNEAVADYCALLGLSPGLIENVTEGQNAYLVALDRRGQLIVSEGDIVDARRQSQIRDIFLIDRPLGDEEATHLAGQPTDAVIGELQARASVVTVNPRVVERLAEADLIIYAPGTQHSSLFPSYLTPGVSEAIASNLTAYKLFITNLRTDAEIGGQSAVDIIDRALYYLREKGRRDIPTPALITHYLINDPGGTEQDRLLPHVPLGRLESLEDPRLVRIGNYEDRLTGRHDASLVLGPFIESFLTETHALKVAVWLYDTESANKLAQTLLEMVRAGVQDLPYAFTVFYSGSHAIAQALVDRLPFRVVALPGHADSHLAQLLARERFDYVILFESSGMYNGEDVVSLASHLAFGRLDAVWGSRRLSARDIRVSYRLRYRNNVVLGSLSWFGSQVLSLGYLLLHGRYISDTLSGARAVRTSYLPEQLDPADKLANTRLLSLLLRRKATVLEMPVQFLALSPERVRRTRVADGLRSLVLMVWWRFRAVRAQQ
ncbi:MAG: 2-phospho-L-lactate transferase CofD family protein [Bacteroidales bacterium]